MNRHVVLLHAPAGALVDRSDDAGTAAPAGDKHGGAPFPKRSLARAACRTAPHTADGIPTDSEASRFPTSVQHTGIGKAGKLHAVNGAWPQ